MGYKDDEQNGLSQVTLCIVLHTMEFANKFHKFVFCHRALNNQKRISMSKKRILSVTLMKL